MCRFAGIRNADRIVVLSKGRVVVEETHDCLLDQNDIYASLFNAQSAKEAAA